MSEILTICGAVKDFGGFRAVDGVDLALEEGSIHSLIGPNGAGKSTLFYLVTGHLALSGGEIRLAGQPISGLPPHRIAQQGLTCTFQATSVFQKLSVRESVELAVLAARNRSLRPMAGINRAVRALAAQGLHETGIEEYAEASASALSHGDQRALEIAMALVTEPKVLLLDEPTAGMSIAETRHTTNLIVRLAREHGITIFLVEHDMSVVFDISDRVTVMHHGVVLAEGLPSEVRANTEVNRVYLGGR